MSKLEGDRELTQYKLKEHVTDEMLISVGFYKTPLGHWRFDVNNNENVLVDKITHEVMALKYDFRLLKLVVVESNKLKDLIDKGMVVEL